MQAIQYAKKAEWEEALRQTHFTVGNRTSVSGECKHKCGDGEVKKLLGMTDSCCEAQVLDPSVPLNKRRSKDKMIRVFR